MIFIVIHALFPLSLGGATKSLEWNAWKNKRNVIILLMIIIKAWN